MAGKEFEWLYYMESICKEFLSRKDGYMQLNFTAEQAVETLKEINDIKQVLNKSHIHYNTRNFGKSLINLNDILKQQTDKPIFYAGRYGNKYIVPQKLYEEQKKVIDIVLKHMTNNGWSNDYTIDFWNMDEEELKVIEKMYKKYKEEENK